MFNNKPTMGMGTEMPDMGMSMADQSGMGMGMGMEMPNMNMSMEQTGSDSDSDTYTNDEDCDDVNSITVSNTSEIVEASSEDTGSGQLDKETAGTGSSVNKTVLLAFLAFLPFILKVLQKLKNVLFYGKNPSRAKNDDL